MPTYLEHYDIILNYFTEKREFNQKISTEKLIVSIFYLYDLLKDIMQEEFNENIEALVNSRPKILIDDKAQNDKMIQYFANFMIDHWIMKRKIIQIKIKNHRDETLGLRIGVGSGKNRLLTTNSITINGARSDFYHIPIKNNLSSYKSIINDELILAPNSAKKLNFFVQRIVKREKISKLEFSEILANPDDDYFFYCFIDLLFRCEPERYLSAFLTHAMFFELIECERYQMTDLPDKLPLAITKDNTCKMGAVSGSRYVRNILGAKYEADASYLSYKQFYDFGPFSEKKGEQLAIRDSIIFLDWLISLQILEGTKEILYLDHYKKLPHIMLQEIGGKVSELEKILEKYSNQVYLQNEISNIMQALNAFFVEIFIGKTLKEIIEE